MDSLFVEITGTDQEQVLLALNILAVNLVDRGWTIHPVTTRYPYETPGGTLVTAPHAMPITQRVRLAEFERLLGEQLETAGVVESLQRYGVTAMAEDDIIVATCPSYRQDYLHPVDVIEDYAISRGYQTFTPLLPE